MQKTSALTLLVTALTAAAVLVAFSMPVPAHAHGVAGRGGWEETISELDGIGRR